MIRKAIVRVEEAATKLILSVLVAIVFSAAVLRYAGYPVNWSLEAAQALMVWLGILAANQAMRARAHVAVDLFDPLIERVPWLSTAFYVLHRVLIAAFLAVMVYYGMKLAFLNTRRLLPSLGISYFWVTVAIPTGCALLLLTLALQTWDDLRSRRWWRLSAERGPHEAPL